MFFSAGDYEQMVKYEVKTESKTTVGQTVAMQANTDGAIISPNEHSAWIIEVNHSFDIVSTIPLLSCFFVTGRIELKFAYAEKFLMLFGIIKFDDAIVYIQFRRK